MRGKAVARVDRAWSVSVHALMVVAAAGLLLLLASTVLDILGRNAGLFSLPGTIEVSDLAMVCLAYVSLPWCFLRRGHIVVDLFTVGLPPTVNTVLDRVWLLVGAGFLAVVAWLVLAEGVRLHATGQVTHILHWSPLVLYLPGAVGAGTSALVCLWLATAPAAPPPPEAPEPSEDPGTSVKD